VGPSLEDADLVVEAFNEAGRDLVLGSAGLSGFLCTRHIMTTNRSQYAKQAQAALRAKPVPELNIPAARLD